MTTSAELELATVTVAPGGEAATTLTVRNDSEIVEAYDLEVVGPCAPWSTVEPARLSLYPGTSETATVRVHPPRSPDVPAGELPLAVRVLPAERPELVTVPETTVFVLPFGELDAVLRPQRRRAWWSARFRVELENRSNVPVTLHPYPADPAEELRFRLTPARVRLDPGARVEQRLRARTPRLIWFGRPVQRTFLLTVAPEQAPGAAPDEQLSEVDAQLVKELPGEVVQLPLLPKWLLALLALLLALLLLWFTLVRPAVQSAARQAADDSTQDAVRSGEVAPGPAALARQSGQAGQPNTGTGTGGANGNQPGQGLAAPGTGGIAGAQQSSATVRVDTPGGGRNSNRFVVPAGKVFLVTDLVLSNYQGDEGLLTVYYGERQITTIALETFRNQDYHWVTPIEIPENAAVVADVTCARPGTPASGQTAPGCAEVLNVSGALRNR